MKKIISLQQFHDLLSNSFAILKNDEIYIPCFVNDVGYDYSLWERPEDGEDIDLSSVDGDIEINENGVVFYLNGVLINISFIQRKKFSPSEIDKLVNNNDELDVTSKPWFHNYCEWKD